MEPSTRYVIVRERLNLLFLFAAVACFTFIGGTATGYWPVFAGIGLFFLVFGLLDLNSAGTFPPGDGFAGLVAGGILVASIGAFAFTQWQSDHPIRAEQTYAVLGLVMTHFVGQDILGWISRRDNCLKESLD